jgi:polyisoprenoid-binding protein YceI
MNRLIFSLKRDILPIAVFFLFGFCFYPTAAQDLYKVQKSSVVISGTSTLHDWKMTAEGFTCSGTFILENARIVDAKSLSLIIPVKALKSGKNAMDKNAYSALKEESYKQISYALTSLKSVGEKLLCVGNLTIAGVTKPVDVESICSLEADQTISCKSTTKLKMTDFNVEPPSFMFGSVTTGDNITLEFHLLFKKTNQSSF